MKLKPKQSLSASVATHVICIALASEQGEAPEWVQLMPFGTFRGRDGRGPYTLAKADAEKVVTASQARAASVEPVFDYCHQTDLAAVAGVGGVAPASGWIKEFQTRDDGIYGRVEWTTAAAEAIGKKEYRYASPVFQHTKSGQVVAILRASLTNTPNLDLAALASEQTHGDDMDLSKIAQALGLGADATEEQILAALAKLTSATAMAAEMAKVRTALKLGADASVDAIVTAIAAQQTGGSSAEALISLQSEVNTLKGQLSKRDATEKVDAAIKAGKVTPAAREQFIAIASETPERFDALVGTLPTIIDPDKSGTNSGGKIVDGKYTLSDEQVALCSEMGWDPDEYAKAKQEELA